MIGKLTKRILLNPFFIRLLHWEYWSFNVVYGPIYLVFVWLGIRAKSFFFFAASNPTIKNGGFLMETKISIDPLIPAPYKPLTLFFEVGTKPETIIAAMNDNHLSYPIIIKPDMGARGRGVKKVYSNDELTALLPLYTVPYIIQPYIAYPKEIGLFYVRMPNEPLGKVTGIVRKEFLQVTGDGEQTILELLQQNERYILQIPILKKILAEQLPIILPKGKSEILLPYGNHARGCLFLDDSHLISTKLEATFNKVCLAIDGFYYGRLDIRYNTWEELERGEKFSIIELNGAGSEPTHIYDPKHSIFFAWNEIIKHWIWLYKISIINNKKGHAYLSYKEGMKMFADNTAYDKKLNALVV